MPRIERIVATEVVVPARPGSINSPGIDQPLHKLPVSGRAAWSVQFDQLPKCVIELTLDDGVTGLGELNRDQDWRVVDGIAARLVGTPLEELPRQRLPIAHCREYDGFECAIWDAFAKCHGLPLVDLLGGAVHDRIRVGAWSGHRTREDVEALAARFAAEGYDCIKFKCDLDDDVVGWCEAIADAGTGMGVILDPERALGVRPSRPGGGSMALSRVGNVLCLEDPIPRWMLQEYANLKAFSADSDRAARVAALHLTWAAGA